MNELFDPKPAQALIARHNAFDYPFDCTFAEATLTITQGVFCPTLTNASPLLLKCIDFKAGERVLDVFSGSGAFGIIAAMRGSHSVTIDISQAATDCTVANARQNNVSGRVDARKGTIETCLSPYEKFDLILANPPLLPGSPETELAAAIFDPGLRATIGFLEMLQTNLAPRGRCYLITSNVFERYGYNVETICTALGLKATRCTEADHGYESYSVHKIVRATTGAAPYTAVTNA